MTGLPPGTILQLLYFKERMKLLGKGSRFLDIGSGNGMLSSLLLKLGLNGVAIDLNAEACKKNSTTNLKYIQNNQFKVIHGDLLEYNDDEKFDLILACMVIEHLPDNSLKLFINQCKKKMKTGGRLVFFVPASMNYWGIEDEIAGHILRYEKNDVIELANKMDLKLLHLAGLTYPLSNFLFRLSNNIISRNESDKLNLSQTERTVYTGNREVNYKTQFPRIFNLVLNEYALYPLHVLQKFFIKNRKSMVIYMELTK